MNRACLLAWLIIVSSVMRLHYSLFKDAQMTPQGYEPNLIFKLVDPAKSVVGKVLVKLTHQIFDSEEWALLQDRHGPFKDWPAALKEHVCNGTTMLYAQVWRRLLYFSYYSGHGS